MARGRWRTTKSERRATGSRVNGRSHDGSDLDLVLRGPDLKEIQSGQLGDFEEAVREPNIPYNAHALARAWVERIYDQLFRVWSQSGAAATLPPVPDP